MNWKRNPTHVQAHVSFTDEVREAVVGRRSLRTRKSQAQAEYDTFRRTAEIGVMVDRALAHQAVEIESSGLYAEHPRGFESAGDLIRDALQGIRRGSTEWYDLKFLAEKLIPFLDQHKIPGKEKLYRKGNISKSRAAANYLNPLFKRPTAVLVPLVEAIMGDLADPGITTKQFQKRYRRAPRNLPCPAYALGNFIVIGCRDEKEREQLQRHLNDKVVWRPERQLALAEIQRAAKK